MTDNMNIQSDIISVYFNSKDDVFPLFASNIQDFGSNVFQQLLGNRWHGKKYVLYIYVCVCVSVYTCTYICLCAFFIRHRTYKNGGNNDWQSLQIVLPYLFLSWLSFPCLHMCEINNI